VKLFCFGDIHIGPSRYSFVKDQEERLCDWVLKSVQSHNCQRVVFLGDCFRDRMHTGKDKDRVWSLFRDIAKVVDVVVIAGNHDYYDKGCEESGLVVLRGMSGVQVVDSEVYREKVGGVDVVYVPWKWCVRREGDVRGDVVFGHFELREAVVWEGREQVGLEDFSDAKLVISGHLHMRKVVGKAVYVGVPFQRGFGDDVRVGGVVVNLETMEWEWVEGYGVRFVQVERVEDLGGLDVRNCYVRVKRRELVDEVRGLGVVGVEYIPEAVRSYDEKERVQVLDGVVIDVWKLLEEYGRKVLRVGDKELEWLRERL
jgi:DNA repair exonuclease SbcCD nuclease subunit